MLPGAKFIFISWVSVTINQSFKFLSPASGSSTFFEHMAAVWVFIFSPYRVVNTASYLFGFITSVVKATVLETLVS